MGATPHHCAVRDVRLTHNTTCGAASCDVGATRLWGRRQSVSRRRPYRGDADRETLRWPHAEQLAYPARRIRWHSASDPNPITRWFQPVRVCVPNPKSVGLCRGPTSSVRAGVNRHITNVSWSASRHVRDSLTIRSRSCCFLFDPSGSTFCGCPSCGAADGVDMLWQIERSFTGNHGTPSVACQFHFLRSISGDPRQESLCGYRQRQ